jgi:predicted dehydrogenase
MTQTLGVGIVGYGAIARVHTAVIQLFAQLYPHVDIVPTIVAIAPGGANSQARALRDFPLVPQVAYETLLQRPDVDIVLCATPTELHFDHVMEALQAGKHVMSEKPLTVNIAQSQLLVATATAHSRVLALNHHFRHVPAIAEMQRQIASGALGAPISAHLRYFRASNVNPQRALTWRFVGHGGGVLVDLGSHLIDLTNFLFESQIVRVQAELRTVISERPNQSGALVAVESDDVAWVTAQLANGMRVSIEASKMVPGAADDVRVEAYGTRASYFFDMLDVNSLGIGDARMGTSMHRTQLWNKMTPAASLPSPETSTGSLSWHAASWQQCLARIAGHETPLCDGSAGLLVDAVIAAAQQSATAGGTWVEVAYE